MPSRPLRLAATAAVLVTALGLAGCRGDDGPSSSPGTTGDATSTTDLGQSPAAYATYADPAQDVVVAVGKRFGLGVVTDPAQGRRWVVTGPPDPAVVLALGTELAPAGTDAPEQGQLQVLTFVAPTVGATTVELTEVGSDGAPVPGVEPVAFRLVITADGLPPTTTTSTSLGTGTTTSRS